MVRRNPTNAAARFGLANELMKAQLWDEAGEHLREYLTSHEDEGNGWGRLADILERQGDTAAAREALETGARKATQHGHPSLASEFEMRIEELDDA